MNLYTIGFSGKSAEEFFTLIRDNGIVRVIDIRLRPSGQLSGVSVGETETSGFGLG